LKGYQEAGREKAKRERRESIHRAPGWLKVWTGLLAFGERFSFAKDV
jgi:hypothetical protein